MADRAVANVKEPEAKQTCSNPCKQNVSLNSSGLLLIEFCNFKDLQAIKRFKC